MIRRTPGSTLPDTLFPSLTLVRSGPGSLAGRIERFCDAKSRGSQRTPLALRPVGRVDWSGRRTRRPGAGTSRHRQNAPALMAHSGLYPCPARSEEHTSELKSLIRTSHAVFFLISTSVVLISVLDAIHYLN